MLVYLRLVAALFPSRANNNALSRAIRANNKKQNQRRRADEQRRRILARR